jgi:hypothetical protein
MALAVFHLERAIEALYSWNLLAGEIDLYVRDREFRMYLFGHRFEKPVNDLFAFIKAVKKLITQIPRNRLWRSAGITLARLAPSGAIQISLFDSPARAEAIERLNLAKLKLNKLYGRQTLRSAATMLISAERPDPADRLDGFNKNGSQKWMDFLDSVRL